MISKEQVKHIAKLARISLSPKEVERFQKELSSILEYVDELKKVDTEKVQPSSQFLTEVLGDKEPDLLLNEDLVENCDPETRKKLIELAPVKEKGYIKVKKVF
jgi:aspartyl-tRNA(Asn)/glutamyl-tRNA(Gln) amidotransferase subunit C